MASGRTVTRWLSSQLCSVEIVEGRDRKTKDVRILFAGVVIVQGRVTDLDSVRKNCHQVAELAVALGGEG